MMKLVTAAAAALAVPASAGWFGRDDDDDSSTVTGYQYTSPITEGQTTCRALILSGGASNGAWQAGVLQGFMTYGNPEDFAYDVVTGVSVGSINTALIGMWQKGAEKAMADTLVDLWSTMTRRDVW